MVSIPSLTAGDVYEGNTLSRKQGQLFIVSHELRIESKRTDGRTDMHQLIVSRSGCQASYELLNVWSRGTHCERDLTRKDNLLAGDWKQYAQLLLHSNSNTANIIASYTNIVP